MNNSMHIDERARPEDDRAATYAPTAAFQRDVDTDLAELDRLAGTLDDAARGAVLLDRALLQQGSNDPTVPARDAREAFELLRSAGQHQQAALAAAVASTMVFRSNDIETAVDLAVDAMILLDGHEQSTHAARALNCVAILFVQICAFEHAHDFSLRALAALDDDTDPIADIVRHTHCLIVIEATHAGVDLPLDTAHRAARQLCDSTGDIARRLLGPGTHAELALIENPERAATLQLDETADALVPRLAGWYKLVLGSLHHARGDHEAALRSLDTAIPLLEAVRYDHSLARAHDLRSRLRDGFDDHRGALADANARADMARSLHIRHVGRLAVQISQRAELERNRESLELRATELAQAVAIDTLTGVGSRRYLEIALSDLASRRSGGVAVVVIDLDHFKTVNDTHGHSAGDAVLRRVGEVLRNAARTGDIVARFGGEEFVAVFSGFGSDRASVFAERIRHRLAEIDWSDITPGFEIRASAGCATGPHCDVRRVLESADAALYEAKRRGRDQTVVA